MKIAALVLAGLTLAGCGRFMGGGANASEDSLVIVGSSMEPTLHCARPAPGCLGRDEDEIVIRTGIPIRRRDIVAFEIGAKGRRLCGAGGLFVKRVVARAGETVSFEGGVVLVNGAKLREPYARGPTDPGEVTKFRVPGQHVFVLGDNRRQSCDSRVWGPLATRRIVGVGAAIERGARRIPLRPER